jgi:hypothetical protein
MEQSAAKALPVKVKQKLLGHHHARRLRQLACKESRRGVLSATGLFKT